MNKADADNEISYRVAPPPPSPGIAGSHPHASSSQDSTQVKTTLSRRSIKYKREHVRSVACTSLRVRVLKRDAKSDSRLTGSSVSNSPPARARAR